MAGPHDVCFPYCVGLLVLCLKLHPRSSLVSKLRLRFCRSTSRPVFYVTHMAHRLRSMSSGFQLEEVAVEHLASSHDLAEDGQLRDFAGLQVLLQSKDHTGPTSIRALTVSSSVQMALNQTAIPLLLWLRWRSCAIDCPGSYPGMSLTVALIAHHRLQHSILTMPGLGVRTCTSLQHTCEHRQTMTPVPLRLPDQGHAQTLRFH